MLALNGAYTTVARGYQCVGVNPANLAYSNGFSMNFLSFNLGVGNNSLSLDVINDLDGADLENPNAEIYFPKHRSFVVVAFSKSPYFGVQKLGPF